LGTACWARLERHFDYKIKVFDETKFVSTYYGLVVTISLKILAFGEMS
jgi:hypothetical protein